jgi:cell division protein ZipA
MTFGGKQRSGLRETLASETDARAAAILPTTGSEDARYVCGSIALPESDGRLRSAGGSYLPDETTEWVVSVQFGKTTPLARDQIRAQFGPQWRKQNGSPTIFGRSVIDGKWTYVLAGGAPEAFSALKFAWPYYASWSEEVGADTKAYEQRIRGVADSAARFGEPAVVPNRTPREAEQEGIRLCAVCKRYVQDSMVVLQAPPGSQFEGRRIWDTMLSLGLRWGDMDLFHWDNPSEWGDDHFFSVWTSNQPGYFLPERIAAGETQVDDLVFGFSVARCYRPMEVAEAMIRSANYSQMRLGGVLLDSEGAAFASDRFLSQVREVILGLEKEGFDPGSSPALHLF